MSVMSFRECLYQLRIIAGNMPAYKLLCFNNLPTIANCQFVKNPDSFQSILRGLDKAGQKRHRKSTG